MKFTKINAQCATHTVPTDRMAPHPDVSGLSNATIQPVAAEYAAATLLTQQVFDFRPLLPNRRNNANA